MVEQFLERELRVFVPVRGVLERLNLRLAGLPLGRFEEEIVVVHGVERRDEVDKVHGSAADTLAEDLEVVAVVEGVHWCASVAKVPEAGNERLTRSFRLKPVHTLESAPNYVRQQSTHGAFNCFREGCDQEKGHSISPFRVIAEGQGEVAYGQLLTDDASIQKCKRCQTYELKRHGTLPYQVPPVGSHRRQRVQPPKLMRYSTAPLVTISTTVPTTVVIAKEPDGMEIQVGLKFPPISSPPSSDKGSGVNDPVAAVAQPAANTVPHRSDPHRKSLVDQPLLKALEVGFVLLNLWFHLEHAWQQFGSPSFA